MPPLETLEQLGRIQATLVLHLSIRQLRTIVSTLGPLYGWECPVQVIYRVVSGQINRSFLFIE